MERNVEREKAKEFNFFFFKKLTCIYEGFPLRKTEVFVRKWRRIIFRKRQSSSIFQIKYYRNIMFILNKGKTLVVFVVEAATASGIIIISCNWY